MAKVQSRWEEGLLLAGARRRVILALVPLAVLWLGVLWAALGLRPAGEPAPPPPPAPPVLQRVVASGTPTPAGGSFDRFDIAGQAIPAPANRRGDVAFFATLLRSEAEEGLFLAAAAGIAKLAVAGDPVPSGEHIAGFTERPGLALNEAGAVAFAATLTGGKATSGVFLARKGKLEAVALSGARAPGIAGGTLADFEQPALNDGDDVAFLAAVRHGRDTGEAIFLNRAGELRKLVATGDAAPSGGVFSGFGLPVINNQGVVAFPAVVEQGPILGGIYVIEDGRARMVLAAGNPAPTGGVFAKLSERIGMNDAGTIAFSAVLRQGGPSSAVFALDGDAARSVAAIGDAAPEGGSFAAFASWPVMAQSGTIGFIASIDGGPSALGIYLAGPDGLRRAVAVGDALPEGGRLSSFSLYPQMAIAADGAATFTAISEGDGGRTDAVFYYGPPRDKRR